MARQLATLGVDVIEAGFPIASEADAEAVRLVATERPGSGHCRAGALHPGRHRSRRLGARRRRRAAASTRSSPPPICTSSASSGCRRETCLDAAVAAVRQARALHRRRAVLGGGRDPQRSGLSLPRRRGGDRRPAHDGQPARHRRLSPSRTRSATFFTAILTACRTPTRRRSAPTATTTSASPWRTRWRRSPPARGRSSARSTASASAPATRRSKRS